MSGRQRVLRALADCMAAGEPAPIYKEIAHRASVSMMSVCRHMSSLRKSGALVTRGARILELRLSAEDAAVVLA